MEGKQLVFQVAHAQLLIADSRRSFGEFKEIGWGVKS